MFIQNPALYIEEISYINLLFLTIAILPEYVDYLLLELSLGGRDNSCLI
jgi:hypothetical protein